MTLTSMRYTLFVLTLIALPLVGIGGLLAGSVGMVAGIVLAVVVYLLAYLAARPLVLRMCRAQRVGPDELPDLQATVVRLSQAAGIRSPSMVLSRLATPNAFAVATPRGGVVGVTPGLVDILTADELEAVLAHEIAHLASPGRSCTTVAAVLAALPGTICVATGADLFYATPFRRSHYRFWGGSRLRWLRDSIALLLAPFAALLVRASASARSELLADQRAVAITGSPAALTSALRKLDSLAGRVITPINPAVAHLLVVHPFGPLRLGRLFDTHPKLDDRLTALADLDTRGS